jgi:hypothetical protein
VTARLWPLFARSAWAQQATVVANTRDRVASLASVPLVGVGPARYRGGKWQGQVRALLWSLLSWSAWTQAATVVAGAKFESAALASFRLVGGGSANQVTTRLFPLFAWTAWDQPATVMAGTTSVAAALATFHLVGMGLACQYGGGHDR